MLLRYYVIGVVSHGITDVVKIAVDTKFTKHERITTG